MICFLIGVAIRIGQDESSGSGWRKVSSKDPGLRALLRTSRSDSPGRTKRALGKSALVGIEDALVPAFIIEEFEDGRCTVFVPSIPTPLAGAVYILDRKQ